MHPTRYTHVLGLIVALFLGVAIGGAAEPADDPAQRLGELFSSRAAGIAFRPPAGGVQSRRLGFGSEIVQYSSAEDKWTLKVSRLIFEKPTEMLAKEDLVKTAPGVLDATAHQLKLQNPALQVLRKDTVAVPAGEVGVIICRFSQGGLVWLRQQAFVMANPQLFYAFDFTTPLNARPQRQGRRRRPGRAHGRGRVRGGARRRCSSSTRRRSSRTSSAAGHGRSR